MADTQETVADIIAEMRGDGHTGPADALEWVRIKLEYYADRLDAAHKREADYAREAYESALKAEREALREQYEAGALVDGTRGDCAKLREALVSVQKKIHYLIGSLNVPNSLVANRMEINGIINAALAAPPRNCDVGTVGQQDERFTAFCNRHFKAVGLCDKDCPCRDFNMIGGACPIVWAQMPYTEGGAK